MTDLFQLAKAQSEELQRRLDRQTGYLWLAGNIQEPEKLRALFQVMARDSEEISAESLKLQAILTQIRIQRQERKELMKQIPVMLILVLMTIFLLANMPTLAQEPGDLATNTPAEALVATLEPTPAPVEVTAEPTPDVPPVVVVNNPPSEGFKFGEFLTGLLSGAAVTLAAVFGMIGRLKNDTSALNAIEWLGKSIPVDALDKLNTLGRNLRDAGEVIDKVTDGKPNLPSGEQSSGVG